jgi:hypothetical protein
MAYPQLLQRVLASIQRRTPVTVYDSDGAGEWLRLESDDLWDYELYEKLSRRWLSIVGSKYRCFALTHCMEGEDAGVWLHFLDTDELREEYLPGHRQLPSWF